MDPAEAEVLSMLRQQQIIEDVISRGDSDIQRFYSNGAVLITGGTGFLGKLLIEKLFRSCKIRKMLLLMRSKKGKGVQQRLTEMFKNPVFEILHKQEPNFQDRIVIIEGDVALPRLGISDEDWHTITEEVTVIFHGAATVRFDEPLQQATLTNVRGTREMLKLGQACKQLRSFVYVSTAYSQAAETRIGQEILEQFYPTSVPPDTVIELAEKFHPNILNDIGPSLMTGWANTYSFTKALAEETVRTIGAGLPVCIVRPSIVIGAYQDPQPGWVDEDNLHGANGLGLGLIMGIIHVLYAKPNVSMSFVPADFVNNAIIAAGWEVGKRWDDGEKEIKIYTVTSARNHLNWAECIKVLHNEVRELSSPRTLWLIYILQARNDLMYNVFKFFLHDLPANVVDGICLLLGKRPKFNSIYAKVNKMSAVLKFFTINNWIFSDDNALKLYKNMSGNDKIMYNFDISTISNVEMFKMWVLGLRKYVIKDGLKGTKYAQKKQKIFKILSFVIVFVLCFIFWMLVQFVFIIVSST